MIRDLFIPSGTITFIGSKERLQKTVTRSGGKLLPNQNFQMTLQTRRDRPFGAAFRFQGSYQGTAQGFELTYRIYPAVTTLICYMVVVFLLLGTWVAILMTPEVANKSVFSILILPMFMYGHWSNCKRCEKSFRKLFSAATGQRRDK